MSERQKPSASNKQPPPQQQQQQQGGDAAAGDSCSDEPANQQLPDCQPTPAPTPTSPSPSPSPAASGAPCVARVASDASARSEPANQQVLPENLESDRPSRPARVTKREGSVVSDHCGSIVIPVGQSTSSSSTIVSSATSVRRHTGSSDSDVKATVRERNAAMLFNDCMADVHFLVGAPGANSQQRIPAHSYVLATASNVFYAMFYGGFANQDDIAIPDVHPTAFRIMLKYLYTDEVDLDADTVLATLYASKKYLITYLTRACINFLETSLTARNVCLLLTQSRLFEEEELMQRCWELIDAQAEMALRSDGFLDVDFHTLEAILGRDTLNVREPAVFKAAIRWAESECKRRSIASSPDELRSLLGDAFYQIRIPAMTIEEFANGPATSGLLNSQETTDVFLWFTATDKPKLKFVSKPRTGLQLERCHRFQSSAYRSNQWRYRGRCDSIQFSADRRIFVAGFGLYGSSNGAADYKVTIELKRAGRTLASIDTRFFSDGSSNVFPVFFDQPVQIDPEVYYTASAVLEGSELSYFGQEGMPEVSCSEHSVTFSFQCSTESTNGTGVQGGQIPEILFFC